jgi:hypothetical protein
MKLRLHSMMPGTGHPALTLRPARPALRSMFSADPVLNALYVKAGHPGARCQLDWWTLEVERPNSQPRTFGAELNTMVRRHCGSC